MTGCSAGTKDIGVSASKENIQEVHAGKEEKEASLINILQDYGDIRYLNILGCNLVVPADTFITTSHAYEEDGILKEDYFISQDTFDHAVEEGIITEEGQLVNTGVMNKVGYEFVQDDCSMNIMVEVSSVDDGELYLNYEDQLKDVKANTGYYDILEETDNAVRLSVTDGTYKILYGLGDSYVITITYYGDYVEDMSVDQIMSMVRLKY